MVRVAIVCKPNKEELSRLLPDLIDCCASMTSIPCWTARAVRTQALRRQWIGPDAGLEAEW